MVILKSLKDYFELLSHIHTPGIEMEQVSVAKVGLSNQFRLWSYWLSRASCVQRIAVVFVALLLLQQLYIMQ